MLVFVGAAVGPLLMGLISNWFGWHQVFYMLIIADLLALVVSNIWYHFWMHI